VSPGTSRANRSAPSSSRFPADERSILVVVGFDTATEDTVACAWRDGEVLHESLLGLGVDGGPLHSTALLAEVERAAEAAGGWQAVERIAVGIGPGSFTGLRIGIATARALAAATGVPATGVCTLDALGRGLSLSTKGERASLAVLDARRGEVFVALYAHDGERLWDPLVCSPDELLERLGELPEAPLAAGSGALRFRNELASRDVEVSGDTDPVHRVAARHICALAAAVEDGGDLSQLAPIYLRPPDAERWRERDTFQTSE
jgi:tRNA threonylcarbamoyladenosine biosynthesis protein TsaB